MAQPSATELVKALITLGESDTAVLGTGDVKLLEMLERLSRVEQATVEAKRAGALKGILALGQRFPVAAVQYLWGFLVDRSSSSAFCAAGGAKILISALENVCENEPNSSTAQIVATVFSMCARDHPTLHSPELLARAVGWCETLHVAPSSESSLSVLELLVCKLGATVVMNTKGFRRRDLIDLGIPRIALRLLRDKKKTFLEPAARMLELCIPDVTVADVIDLASRGLFSCVLAAWQRFPDVLMITATSCSVACMCLEILRRSAPPSVYEPQRSAFITLGAVTVATTLLPRCASPDIVEVILFVLHTCVRGLETAKDMALTAGAIKASVNTLNKFLGGRGVRSPPLVDVGDAWTFNGVQLFNELCEGDHAEPRKQEFLAAGGLAIIETIRVACLPPIPQNARLRAAIDALRMLVSAIPLVGGQLACSNAGCVSLMTSRCGKCAAPYCSRACQSAHWPAHKRDCKVRAAAQAQMVLEATIAGAIHESRFFNGHPLA